MENQELKQKELEKNNPDIKFEIKELRDGQDVSVCTLNKGYTHIIDDDHCWVILNGKGTKKQPYGVSAWIFPKAMEVLKCLPNCTKDYEPLMLFLQDEPI